MPAGIHRQFALEAHERLGVHLELLGCSHHTTLKVGDLQLQLDVAHGRISITVGDGQRAPEGLTRHRHGLLNLEGDGSTRAVASLHHLLRELVELSGQQFTDTLIAFLTGRSVGLVHDVQLSFNDLGMNHVVRRRTLVLIIHDGIGTFNELVELRVADVFWLVGAQVVGIEVTMFRSFVHSRQEVMYLLERSMVLPSV